MKRILQLEHQLANQIAAGEVVERPASVVKELIENSIDAQATRIQVDIERGGARLIRIKDDGLGIHPDDLALALSRHATSKIHSFEELCALNTLGFRGEALASIASVSHLILQSRLRDHQQGWQAIAEGRDMQAKVMPVAAQEGTCVEVRDLFFNTPARRKFLRAEKTEFLHIEDVIKRAAVSNPSVAFVLKHNGKVVKRYAAVDDFMQLLPKITSALGQTFTKSAIEFSGNLDELNVFGWLGDIQHHRSESDAQLVFVNGRAVKDKLLFHAVRQAYSDHIPQGRFASFIIFLTLPSDQVDVNVHPTKHEVRFRYPRQIHDYLVSLVSQSLSKTGDLLNISGLSETDHAMASKDNKGSDEAPLNETVPLNETASEHVLSEEHSLSENTSVYPSMQESQARVSARPSMSRVREEMKHYFSSVADKADKKQQEWINQQCFNQNKQEHSSTLQDDGKDLPVSFSEQESYLDNSLACVWLNQIAIYSDNEQLWLIDAHALWLHVIETNWMAVEKTPLLNQAILIPHRLTLNHPEVFEDATIFEQLLQLGFELSVANDHDILIRKIPQMDCMQNATPLWLLLLQHLSEQVVINTSLKALIQQLLLLLKTIPLDNVFDLKHWFTQWMSKHQQQTDLWQAFSGTMTATAIEHLLPTFAATSTDSHTEESSVETTEFKTTCDI